METIRTSYHSPSGLWTATFDSYDGTPDATAEQSLYSMAATEELAIADLKEQAAEYDLKEN
jgi:hypothetical protein